MAQDGAYDMANGGDTAWLLAATCLALFTSLPGFALFASGQTPGRSQATVLFQCIEVALLGVLSWTLVGYTLAFGSVSGGILGSGNAWMLANLANIRAGTQIPESAYALFQMIGATLAPTLVAGALAGRVRTRWLLAFTGLWSLVVYAPMAHWIWGGGWLAASFGTFDWNGGIVLATTCGTSAVTLALIVGPRRQTAIAPLGQVLTVLGAFLFMVGRVASAGAGAMTANDDAAAAMLSTLLAGATGALVWSALTQWRSATAGALSLARGTLAGLAAVATSAGYVSPGGATVVALLGTIAGHQVACLLHRSARIHDAGLVIAIFAGAGISGSLLAVPFLSPALGGTGFDPHFAFASPFLAQGFGVLVAAAWSMIASLVLATMVSVALPMRVSQDREANGLDTASNGEA
ncbi:ammonium transporter [Novosphingobium profundi]|uniref:ammonium transporter n=1 Tax=Novosphingobium profundi TaxID=1774954 RepID=UPI001BDABDD9|nr:ammonium transporter [Novosphingobium profundi]MBT0669712.1 ammonium transporter [Novosphingobium profundi]